mmetsp:Transcript_110997/g.318941  ORF Transcript_110997/g.318941 Transcript_110997/m.318941 type:complete len:341 (-) Transcript_110997:2756-3778(-)
MAVDLGDVLLQWVHQLQHRLRPLSCRGRLIIRACQLRRPAPCLRRMHQFDVVTDPPSVFSKPQLANQAHPRNKYSAIGKLVLLLLQCFFEGAAQALCLLFQNRFPRRGGLLAGRLRVGSFLQLRPQLDFGLRSLRLGLCKLQLKMLNLSFHRGVSLQLRLRILQALRMDPAQGLLGAGPGFGTGRSRRLRLSKLFQQLSHPLLHRSLFHPRNLLVIRSFRLNLSVGVLQAAQLAFQRLPTAVILKFGCGRRCRKRLRELILQVSPDLLRRVLPLSRCLFLMCRRRLHLHDRRLQPLHVALERIPIAASPCLRHGRSRRHRRSKFRLQLLHPFFHLGLVSG